MSEQSEYLLTTHTHPGDSSLEIVIGQKCKGDGYYGYTDGVHSVQYTFDGFTGSIEIQATLVLEPADHIDWFVVHSYDALNESSSKIETFIGNYTWIRARVLYYDGTIHSIVLNHWDGFNMVKIVEVMSSDSSQFTFDIVDDIMVFIKNDSMFYQKHYYPSIIRLKQLFDQNKLDQYKRVLEPVLNTAIDIYCQKYKIGFPEHVNKEERLALLQRIYDEEIENIKQGEY